MMQRLACLGLALSVLSLAPTGIALGQQLDLPVIEKTEGDLDTCALAEVHGLNPNGDGFLAVRSAPGTEYRELDRVYNGNRVWVFNQVGDWFGIVYGVDEVDCSPINGNNPVRADGKQGWVHQNWVRIIAG
ncbi:MAG: SH3 domain-containing protein [Pseudomonadota bacterium]